MFQVNDKVLYGVNGVCEIVSIEEREFGDKMVEYYILKPINAEHSTIFVPTQNKKLTSKMRALLSKEEICKSIRIIHQLGMEWINDERRRKERYKEIVDHADASEMIRAVEILLEHQKDVMAKGKKLHIMDEKMLHESEKIICDEFSYVLGIKETEVLPYIGHAIKNGDE